MGVSGAALATILSQALSAAWVLRFLTSKKSGVRLSLRTMKPDFSILGSSWHSASHHLSCRNGKCHHNRHEPRATDVRRRPLCRLDDNSPVGAAADFRTGQRLYERCTADHPATTLVQASLTVSARQFGA